MCNFNKQNEDAKALLHLFMKEAAQNVGGTNFLLALIEAMKKQKPNALMFKGCQIASENTIIKWNKVVYKDKVEVIEEVLTAHKSSENLDFNILSAVNDKKKKIIINMVRTLTPIEFVVIPQNYKDGDGFKFKVFETIQENKIVFNPVFMAMFFCSTEFTKKALKYQI